MKILDKNKWAYLSQWYIWTFQRHRHIDTACDLTYPVCVSAIATTKNGKCFWRQLNAMERCPASNSCIQRECTRVARRNDTTELHFGFPFLSPLKCSQLQDGGFPHKPIILQTIVQSFLKQKNLRILIGFQHDVCLGFCYSTLALGSFTRLKVVFAMARCQFCHLFRDLGNEYWICPKPACILTPCLSTS